MNEKWYEVRVDYEKVAAFAPSRLDSLEESLEQARNVIKTIRDNLYKNKVLQILECEGWGSTNDTLHHLHTVIYETGGWEDTE